jgi:hypothetical protein
MKMTGRKCGFAGRSERRPDGSAPRAVDNAIPYLT